MPSTLIPAPVSFPRLCLETAPETSNLNEPTLVSLFEAFEESTGWVLAAVPGSRKPAIEISDLSELGGEKPLHRQRCDRLAASIGDIWGELLVARELLARYRADSDEAVECTDSVPGSQKTITGRIATKLEQDALLHDLRNRR